MDDSTIAFAFPVDFVPAARMVRGAVSSLGLFFFETRRNLEIFRPSMETTLTLARGPAKLCRPEKAFLQPSREPRQLNSIHPPEGQEEVACTWFIVFKAIWRGWS